MKKTQFVILICFYTTLISAQDQFVVYSTTGEVTMSEKNKKLIITAGQRIPSTNSITIAESSGITLLGKDGSFFSTTQSGTYLLSNFKDSCHKSNSGQLNNFLKFLWDQATIKQVNTPGTNRKKYFDYIFVRTGPENNNIWINYQCFDTTNYSGIPGDFGFYWLSYTKAKEYEFSLYAAPNTETPFYEVIVKEMRMPFIDLSAQIKPGNWYYWTANIKGLNETSLFVLNYVTPQFYDSVLTSINKQKPMVEGPAEEAYRTAFMLENWHYLAEANYYYKKAADLAAGNILYKSTYLLFKKEFWIK